MAKQEEETAVMPEIMESNLALASQIKAETDIQINTAKRYPREISRVRKSVFELATCSEETAAGCFYALPRGSKPITGPSVRLAEIVATSYGNLRTASRVIAIEEKYVVSQAVCIDLENNNSVSVEVRRRITNSKGVRFNEDMIVLTANAGAAIAFRNAIFKVVPVAVLTDIYPKIKAVGLGDERTLVARRNAAIEYFKKEGVKKKRVLALIGCSDVADITLDKLAILIGVTEAIKEGTTTIGQAFAESEDRTADGVMEPGRHALHEEPEAKKPPRKKPPAPKPEVEAPTEAEAPAEPACCMEHNDLARLRFKHPQVFAEVLRDGGKEKFEDIDPNDAATCARLLETLTARLKGEE